MNLQRISDDYDEDNDKVENFQTGAEPLGNSTKTKSNHRIRFSQLNTEEKLSHKEEIKKMKKERKLKKKARPGIL